MTHSEFVELIKEVEHHNELTQDQERIAKENNLIVVFGYSDDNMEFRGALYDEVGCYEGGSAFITTNGELLQEPDCGCDHSINWWVSEKNKATEIEAVWCPKDESGQVICSWAYKTKAEHSTFNVMEDGDLYCIGIVFDLS